MLPRQTEPGVDARRYAALLDKVHERFFVDENPTEYFAGGQLALPDLAIDRVAVGPERGCGLVHGQVQTSKVIIMHLCHLLPISPHALIPQRHTACIDM